MRFGPPVGHDLSKPVSRETSSRLGPRHCGQSKLALSTVPHNPRTAEMATNKCFISRFQLCPLTAPDGGGLRMRAERLYTRTDVDPEVPFLLPRYKDCVCTRIFRGCDTQQFHMI